jgi:hypothetical protein
LKAGKEFFCIILFPLHGCKNRGLNFYCKNQAGGFINILSLVVQQAKQLPKSGGLVVKSSFVLLSKFLLG